MSRPCLNEAEVRAKIVDVWLRDHGFTSDQISLERTFRIRLGRARYVVGLRTLPDSSQARPRADYLVRTHDGHNLFIVETKAAGEPIDDESRKQAVSYARLLDEGGIAPFAIVTNGALTQVIDSITGETIGAETIPLGHPYVAAGYRVSVDDLSIRAEALEHLISLSPDNLLAFCRAQVSERMKRLRSDDLRSGFKYIPALYIEREAQRDRLLELIHSDHKCVLVLGPPQVGKTNFICHFVEEQLRSGIPCLFYPAVGVESGLLEAIKEDFEWNFGDSSSPFQIIRHKLRSVLARLNQKLTIFVEGLNENQDFIKSFSSESERLQNERICLIVSFTTYSAGKILLDAAGNPTYVATATGVQKRDVPLLEISPSNVATNLSAIHLDSFSSQEKDRAYSLYAKAFEVSVPSDHLRTNEPLLLRNAMERFQRDVLPSTLDAAEILAETIKEKVARLIGISGNAGRAILEETALRICEGRPVSTFWLYQTVKRIDSFFEAALLSTRGSGVSRGTVDFYVSSERSFVISHWVRCWPSVLASSTSDIQVELMFALNSEAATEALRWFFRQGVNRERLRRLAQNLDDFTDARLRRLIVLCLCEYLVHAADEDNKEKERLSDFISDGPLDIAIDQSEVTKLLRSMLVDAHEDLEIRRNAAIALGRFSPDVCLVSLAELSRATSKETYDVVGHALEPGFAEVVHQIMENYYGFYCQGALEGLEDPESRLEEYSDVIQTWMPTIRMFHFSKSAADLEELLRELNPEHKTVLDFSCQKELFE